VEAIGLPEVRLGVVPGAGGCVRLPRLVGLYAALPLILGGKTLSAAAAKRLGLVDAVLTVSGGAATTFDALIGRVLAALPTPLRARPLPRKYPARWLGHSRSEQWLLRTAARRQLAKLRAMLIRGVVTCACLR
jgi:enoyl-CoA hydratase/carnithine racemase